MNTKDKLNKAIADFGKRYGGLGASNNCAGFRAQYNKSDTAVYIYDKYRNVHTVVEGSDGLYLLSKTVSEVILQALDTSKRVTGARPFSEDAPTRWRIYDDGDGKLRLTPIYPFQPEYDLPGLLEEGEDFEFTK
jgi:hypothetical protein